LLEEIIIAIRAYGRAHRLIRKQQLWKWILVPGIVYTVLFAAACYFFWESSAAAIDFVFSRTGLKTWLQHETGGWLRFLFFFGQLVLHLMLMLLYFSWFKYLILVAGAPIFVWLMNKTQAFTGLSPQAPEFTGQMMRGIRVALRNFLWQTFFMMCILFVSLVPVAGWVTPLLAVFVECYYFGYSMMDYTNARRGLSLTQSNQFISRHKGLPIGNGIVFYGMHLPVVAGWLLAPGYATIAASLSLHEEAPQSRQRAPGGVEEPGTLHLKPGIRS